MSIFRNVFGRKEAEIVPLSWPHLPTWSALRNNETIQTKDGSRFLWTMGCGELALPSGRLVVCDPFVTLGPKDNPVIYTPKGSFPVFVTLADVSEKQNKSHIREAYASIVFSSVSEKTRKALPLVKDGQERPEMKGDEFIGFGVDTGTACFVDDSVIGPCMPDPKTWYNELFENQRPDCWFSRMDDPAHIRAGVANIVLPYAKNGENVILFHSGWGDGHYPVVGSFDAVDRLVAVHIDFFVIK